MYLNDRTGRGIRIAVIDSGVHADHPHIVSPRPNELSPGAPPVTGIGIREDGSVDEDYVDRLGHGTAVAAAIREKAPDAQILAIKVFWTRLSTDVRTLARAIDEASSRAASVINLSLGTADVAHRAQLEEAVRRAAARGAMVVSAGEHENVRWLPGDLDDMITVRLDWACPRDTYRIAGAGARRIVIASGYPRDIPGVPKDRNLKGISFAVANATGFVARAREAAPDASPGQVLDLLAAQAPGSTRAESAYRS